MMAPSRRISSFRRYGSQLAPGRYVGGILILGVLCVSLLEPVSAASPVWKVGRAVIEVRQPSPASPGQSALVVKLSLRNAGVPGNVPVQIFGRWGVQPPPALTLLASFGQEVAFKQTAILEVPLTPLRGIPPGRPPLELAVMTGPQETDRQWINMTP